MTAIQGSRDCGNSPKNKFVQDMAIAIETNDIQPGSMSDDIVWLGIDDGPLTGMAAVEAELAGRAKPEELIIDHAISHGKAGVATGVATDADGRTRRFCHVLEFTTAKANCVAVIKSYF